MVLQNLVLHVELYIYKCIYTSVVSLNMCVRIYVHMILYYCASVVLIRILP